MIHRNQPELCHSLILPKRSRGLGLLETLQRVSLLEDIGVLLWQ